VIWTVSLSFAASALSAQEQGLERVLVAPFIDEIPQLDRRLDESLWTRAAQADAFTQREPRGGQPATVATDVRVFYTARTLYIGAILQDTEPLRIVSSEYVRDAPLDANDSFEVFLDTFHDRRNAFYFVTNAVGAQRDGLVRNEGETLNWEWDAVWHVASARDERGWSTELAIPFATLRFDPRAGGSWGVNFGRLVARTREESYWAPIDRNWGFNGKWRVSAFGELRGLHDVRPGGRFPLKPFLLGGVGRDYEEATHVGWMGEVGLDAKIALTPTLVTDLTWNTDFAQVESDQQQVNLTRFPLFFPEKREFFLENAGLFQIGERSAPFEPPGTLLFFSRRIGLTDDGDLVPLIGGVRLTGRAAAYEIGALDIVSRAAQVGDTRVPRTNFAALRVKRNVWSRSSLGAFLLSKSPAEEGSSNEVLGGDANFAFRGHGALTAFAARSSTPGSEGAGHALGLDGGWETDRLLLRGAYLDIADSFRSDMGFVPRAGIRKYRGTAYLGRRPGVLSIRQFFFGDNHQYYADRGGRLQTQVNSLGPAVIFKDGSLLFANWVNNAEGLTEAFEIRDGAEVPVGTYRFNQATLFYAGDRSRALSFRSGLTMGGFYHGDIRAFNIASQLRPLDRVTLELEYARNGINLPVRGGRFSTNLVIGRAAFAFSPRMFIRALLQANDDDQQARANVLFRYTYRPGADLFIVYNEDRGIRGAQPSLKRRELVAKLTIYVVPG
jgi:hypothetical protein